MEVAPDEVTQNFFTDPNKPLQKPHAFCYFHSDNANDNITTFPWYNSGGSLSSAGVLTNFGTGDSRISAPYGVNEITGQTITNSYSGGSLALPINTGRYVTPVMYFYNDSSFPKYGVRSYSFKVKSEQYTHTFKDIDTSTLSGSSSARTFTWSSPRFGRIKDVIIVASDSETNSIIGKLTTAPSDNTQSITFKVVRATDGAAVDATVDIFMAGFPEVKHITHTDVDGNTRAIEYKQNFEGTL